MIGLRVAPGELIRGEDAVGVLARRLRDRTPAAAAGGPALLLVHGSVGYPEVRARLDAALSDAGIEVARFHHRGACSQAAIDAIAAAVGRSGATWVLGVGGGRVVDAAKGAAQQARVRFAALPTSPATCAATAPTVVLYDPEGRHRAVREDGPSAALTALDPAVLTAAPDRLLASGILDAWAKVREVRLTSGPPGSWAATTRAAVALLDDLAALLTEHGRAALAAGPDGRFDAALRPRRLLVAEAVVTYPGLIGGLAGADAKLALAHPLHDALTQLPGSSAALHGEKVGFGTLVQIRLAGRGGGESGDAERTAAMHAEAAAYAELGVACHLEALGCAAARTPAVEAAVVRWTLADPAVRQALPDLTPERLVRAVREVDAWVRGSMP